MKIVLVIFVLFYIAHGFKSMRNVAISRKNIAVGRIIRTESPSSALWAKDDGENSKRGDTGGRRRRRRRTKDSSAEKQVTNTMSVPSPSADPKVVPRDVPKADIAASTSRSSGDEKVNQLGDGLESIEASFGLSDTQLRELNDQELPVPREDLVTGRTMEASSDKDDKVFNLPDLNEYLDESKTDEAIERERERQRVLDTKIDRSNMDEYERVLQLNPFADADETMFEDEYDIFQAIFGTGKLLTIPVPYLQTGHGILLLVTLLAANVYAPGNPLTEFPPEIREFLREGLLVVGAINTVLAVAAFNVARGKNLPGVFWAVKCLLIGGVSFYEINQARDPTLPRDPFHGDDPSIRKAKR